MGRCASTLTYCSCSKNPARGADSCNIAILGFIALLVTAASDNPLVYNVWFMNPLFAVLGLLWCLPMAVLIRWMARPD